MSDQWEADYSKKLDEEDKKEGLLNNAIKSFKDRVKRLGSLKLTLDRAQIQIDILRSMLLNHSEYSICGCCKGVFNGEVEGELVEDLDCRLCDHCLEDWKACLSEHGVEGE